MNEQEQSSQLSALFDGELPTQQAEMVIRRALKDASLRGRWERYALIGACLRGEPLAHAGTTEPSVAQLVRLRLASEAEHGQPASMPVPASAPGRSLTWGRGLMGGAIAASVALVSVLLVRPIMQPAGIAPGEVAQADVPVAAEAAPRSYTTPGENSPASNRLDQPLAHYLVAHSEAAASNLGFSYDLTQGAVEMTEAEIKAHR